MQTIRATQFGTLLELLAHAFPESSRSTLRSWIKTGRILVNDVTAKTSSLAIQEGDSLCLLPKPRPMAGPLKIHFEDQHLIVVEKPSGLASVATNDPKEPSAHAYVKKHHPGGKVYVIHRLDKETSGIMVFAFTQRAFVALKEELKARHVKRIYRAVVEGCLSENGSWKNYLLEDRFLKMHVVSPGTPDSEYAVTHYEVLRSSSSYTLLDCHLMTGKKNQIRIQASHAGHPIVGDSKYGSNSRSKLCLHARLLSFHHPITKSLLIFESPPPTFFDFIFQK